MCVVEVINTVIYFISRPILPPTDALASVLPRLELSTFLAAIFSTSLADVIKTMPRSTILMPHNKGFERLGALVSDHLLSSAGKSDLAHVIMHHVVDGVYYSHSLTNVSGKSIPTDDGSDIRLVNGSFIASGGWPDGTANLHLKNLITETGVVHELSDVLLPRTVELTVGKLARAAKGSLMPSMLVKAGFDWVLNATAPPAGSPWAEMGLDGKGWTLLCPPDDAFKHMNMTELVKDTERLMELVGQHLIPTPSYPSSIFTSAEQAKDEDSNRPISLRNDATYSTLISPNNVYGDIVVRSPATPGSPLVLGIKGARGTSAQEDWAQVLSWGRATTGDGVGGVIVIDRLLTPYRPPWFVEYGQPIGGGILGILSIGAFFYGVRWLWNKEIDATYEPLDRAAPEEDQ
jgi:solute carrier family 25 carnitine/acylcarnitine transporter 20/29